MLKIVRQTMLYDFYGELLTPRQREVYEDVVLNDISYSEVAAEKEISRQSVHELVKRCDQTLQSYEEKLHLVERFLKTREDVAKIRELAGAQDVKHERVMQEIMRISDRILEEI